MNKLGQIFKLDDSNMLDIIFTAIEEELSGLIERDVETIYKTAKQTNQAEAYFNEYLNKIPDEYKELKDKIIDAFNQYTNALDYREGYFNEKYYKAGIKDGVNILINCFVRS